VGAAAWAGGGGGGAALAPVGKDATGGQGPSAAMALCDDVRPPARAPAGRPACGVTRCGSQSCAGGVVNLVCGWARVRTRQVLAMAAAEHTVHGQAAGARWRKVCRHTAPSRYSRYSPRTAVTVLCARCDGSQRLTPRSQDSDQRRKID
jgi:hypothetical protein